MSERSDVTIEFNPPVRLFDLVAQAEEEEWAIAATTMLSRMLKVVVEKGSVPHQWLASLMIFGLAERDETKLATAGRIPCRLTAAGTHAAQQTMVLR